MNDEFLSIIALFTTLLLFAGLFLLGKKGVGFSVRILIALVLGVVLGVAFPSNLTYTTLFGRVYTRIITAVVAPLIILSILSSVTSLGSATRLKSLGLRSVFWLLISTLASIILTLVVGLALGVGSGTTISLTDVDASSLDSKLTTLTTVILDFFPTNVVTDIQSNSIIPIIITSLGLALAYIVAPNKEKVEPFRRFVDAAKELVYIIVEFIIGLTPYAVLSLIANAVSKATSAADTIIPLLLLLVVTYLLAFLHTYIFNGAIIAAFAKINPLRFFKKISGAQATAFTTQSSVGTLPSTISQLTENIGVSEEVANFTAPLGTTIGMPGCAGIWPVLLAVFAINALGISYTVGDYIQLVIIALAVSLGTAGVPGTATVTATAVFTAAGLPVEVIILLSPISSIADMARTATNVTAAAVSATIVAKQTDALDLTVFNRNKEIKSASEHNLA